MNIYLRCVMHIESSGVIPDDLHLGRRFVVWRALCIDPVLASRVQCWIALKKTHVSMWLTKRCPNKLISTSMFMMTVMTILNRNNRNEKTDARSHIYIHHLVQGVKKNYVWCFIKFRACLTSRLQQSQHKTLLDV